VLIYPNAFEALHGSDSLRFRGRTIVDIMPQWMGGLPEHVPPCPAAPKYEEWLCGREATTVKSSNGSTAK